MRLGLDLIQLDSKARQGNWQSTVEEGERKLEYRRHYRDRVGDGREVDVFA